MNLINKHFDKNNLHHAYLIEGVREDIMPEVLAFIKDLGVNTVGNPDFSSVMIDSFKINDARSLKSFASEKGYSVNKKIFIISANNFLLEAQNSLLKIFEEPIENTHFFIIVPDASIFLKTFISRFYFVSTKTDLTESTDAEKFIKMSLRDRIEFIKELLTEVEEDEEGEVISLDSTRSKALKFLNELEVVLHNNMIKNFSGLLQPPAGTFPVQNSLPSCFEHFFKVREFLRMPGSSTKSLMESMALVVPVL